MLQKVLLISIGILGMIGLSLPVHAVSDTTQIGIRVVIKSSLQCDYDYYLENISTAYNEYSRSSSCHINSVKLQQHLDQVAYSTAKTSNMRIDDKHYRVFMTVQ